MFRLGYLDDDKVFRTTFARQFGKEFDVFIFQELNRITTLEDLLNVLEEENLDALAVDYLLSGDGVIAYNGDEIVSFLEERKKYFPVFVTTSHVDGALDKMNDVFLVNDKENLSDDSFRLSLIEKVKRAVGSYHRRVDGIEEKVRELESKQKSGEGLTDEEEQTLLKLHMELHAIDPKANPLSSDVLQTQSIRELQELVRNSRELLKSFE